MAGGWRRGAAVHTRARSPWGEGRGLLSRPGWSHSGGSQSPHMSPEAESVRGGQGCGRFPVCSLGRCVLSTCSAPALFQGALSRKDQQDVLLRVVWGRSRNRLWFFQTRNKTRSNKGNPKGLEMARELGHQTPGPLSPGASVWA